MDGTDLPEPAATLKRLLHSAFKTSADVYIFGRTYAPPDRGIHDVHMNQGSSGGFLNNGHDDHNDHNDVWQDGAVLVDVGQPEWAAYFTAFSQQNVPTDILGNPAGDSHGITDEDVGEHGRTIRVRIDVDQTAVNNGVDGATGAGLRVRLPL
jgi:uncharacterized protein YukJ